jgi:hypothetical protein
MNSIIEVDAEILTTASNLEIEVAKLKVVDAPSFEAVMGIRRQAKESDRKAEEWFKSLKKPLDEAKERILETEKDVRARFAGIIMVADRNCRAWEITEELKRRDAQRAAQEAARRAIEEERLAEAIELDKTDPGAAQALLEAPIVATVSVESVVPEIAGMSQRESWSAEVVSFQALVAHVADHVEFMNLLLPNEPALNAMARAQKSLLQLPGVQPVVKSSYVQR